ncbi:MAG: FAD-dependent oxidoreductase [Thermoplasmata archaeon]|nr:FAD-dependent oxidoreductase [Thermoplasmata archaeon]
MGDVSLVLEDTREAALQTKTFLFRTEGLIGAEAGQYLMVKLDVPADSRRGSRSFTMANAPGEGRVMITTRVRSTSPFKQAFASLRLGDRIPAKGPFGKFTLHAGDAPALFLAGGIGVTPFRSMVRHALDERRSVRMALLTSDWTPESIPFREELDSWARAQTSFQIARTVTRLANSRDEWSGHVGRIDAAWIRQHLEPSESTIAYVAGSPSFVAGMRSLLASLGFPEERIRFEQFIGY